MAKRITDIQAIIFITLLGLTIIFGWFFFERYNLPYNSENCYFDEANAIVYHQQAVEIYGLICFVFFVLTLVSLIWILKSNTNNK